MEQYRRSRHMRVAGGRQRSHGPASAYITGIGDMRGRQGKGRRLLLAYYWSQLAMDAAKVAGRFRERTVLVTGSTGFLGKCTSHPSFSKHRRLKLEFLL